MKLRSLATAAAFAAMLAVPQVAEAAWGYVAGASALNLRTCASASCSRITSMPYGARVWIMGATGGWYQLNYNGRVGYASARYVAAGPVAGPAVRYPAPPPAYWGPGPGRYPWPYTHYPYRQPGFYFGFRIGP